MDLNKIISALNSSGVTGGLAGGVAGGALTSALMGKKGGKTAKNVLKIGGLAAVGGLAWNAYRNYQNSQLNPGGQPEQPNAPQKPAAVADDWQALPSSAFEVSNSARAGSSGVLLIRAMITAAMSDGHLDDSERQRILKRLGEMNLAEDEKSLVLTELLAPKTMDEIVAAVCDRALAAEVYVASAMAIDENSDQGRAYLTTLAARLELPPGLVEAFSAARQQTSEHAA